jgi:wobble nucleotide-excising tRNase
MVWGYEFEVAQEPRIEAAHVQVCNLVVKLSEVNLTFHEGMQNEIVLQQVMNTIKKCSVNNIISYLIIS